MKSRSETRLVTAMAKVADADLALLEDYERVLRMLLAAGERMSEGPLFTKRQIADLGRDFMGLAISGLKDLGVQPQ